MSLNDSGGFLEGLEGFCLEDIKVGPVLRGLEGVGLQNVGTYD